MTTPFNAQAEIKALHKIVGDLAVTVGELAQRFGATMPETEQPRVDATGFSAFDLDEDAPIMPQLRELLAEAGLRQVGTLIVKAGPMMTLDELFKSLETPRPPETFAQAADRIVREFAKGCTVGQPGGCEDCLAGAVSALIAKHEETKK